MNQRLKDALVRDVASKDSEAILKPINETNDSRNITTTEDEMEAFRVIRAILAKNIDPKRVSIRDAASYCAILLDDNNRKPIVRLYLEKKEKE